MCKKRAWSYQQELGSKSTKHRHNIVSLARLSTHFLQPSHSRASSVPSVIATLHMSQIVWPTCFLFLVVVYVLSFAVLPVLSVAAPADFFGGCRALRITCVDVTLRNVTGCEKADITYISIHHACCMLARGVYVSLVVYILMG